MKNVNTGKTLSEYNSIIKENDELYHKIARSFGMSDCAFWILYMLRESGNDMTQSDICNVTYQPKQTVNSALKKLEKEKYIYLDGAGGRNGKQIKLTDEGADFASYTVDKVITVEKKALAGLTAEEQETFIGLFHKYTKLLEANMQELL